MLQAWLLSWDRVDWPQTLGLKEEMENGDPANFFETGASDHIAAFVVFGIFILTILIWGIVARVKNHRSYIFSALSSISGLGIFFYSQYQMHGITAFILRNKLQSGGPGFFEETFRDARLEIALGALNFLAFLAQVFAVILLLIHYQRHRPNESSHPCPDRQESK